MIGSPRCSIRFALAVASSGSKRAVFLPMFAVLAPPLPLAAYVLHAWSQASWPCATCATRSSWGLELSNYEQKYEDEAVFVAVGFRMRVLVKQHHLIHLKQLLLFHMVDGDVT